MNLLFQLQSLITNSNYKSAILIANPNYESTISIAKFDNKPKL